jgi:hypothetical protein
LEETRKARRFLLPWNREKPGKRFHSDGMKKGDYAAGHNPLKLFGWGIGIRTPIHGVRVRCPTVERSPIKSSKQNYRKSTGESIKKYSPNTPSIFS